MRVLALTVSVLLATLALPASAPAAVSAGGTGWVWANPLPQGGDLDAIAFSGARGIAAGASVSVTARIGGSWVRKFAAVAGVQADGTAPLRVRLGGHRHR